MELVLREELLVNADTKVEILIWKCADPNLEVRRAEARVLTCFGYYSIVVQPSQTCSGDD